MSKRKLKCSSIAVALFLGGCQTMTGGADGAVGCAIGAYKHANNTVIVYDRGRDADEHVPAYVYLDGRRGGMQADGSELNCQNGQLQADTGARLERFDIVTRDISFQRGSVTLKGRLFLPEGIPASETSLAVLVHGSERTGWLDRAYMPYMLASQGLSVFAYDKRGTGQSEGTYTQNFETLALDAVQALKAARQAYRPGFRAEGYVGFSQGGWVAPLAATTSNVDYIVVAYGLIISPLEEDAEQIVQEMQALGYGETDVTNAKRLAVFAGRVLASRFTQGVDQFLALRARFASEPWLGQIEGEFTGELVRAEESDLRSGKVGDLRESELDWDYDAYGVIRSLSIPQFWILAGEDRQAPVQLTKNRLRDLQDEGYPVYTALYPNTDHGVVQFIEDDNGSRTYTGYPDSYFRLLADASKQKLKTSYSGANVRFPSNELD